MRAKFLLVSKISIAVVTMFLIPNGTSIKAQHSGQLDSSMVARLVRYEVKPEYQAAFRKAVSDYVLYSIVLESNVLSEAYHEQDKPSVMWIVERWSSKSELDKIIRSTQSKTMESLAQNALLQPAKIFYMKDLEPLSKKEWRKVPKKDDKPITIMLFVDSKAGTESTFKQVYHIAMPQFRSEPGVINYQLSQLEEDSTQFVTYEKFRNDDAFQYHLNFPAILPVIDYLNTSIKKQPFQSGLHKLIEFVPLTRE